jgi:hypothetical protein
VAWTAGGTGYYKRATGLGGQTSHWSSSPISITTDTCSFLEVRLVNGRPGIAFIGDNQQRYVRSSTANGDTQAAWPGGSILLSGADNVVHGDVAFSVVAGNPAVVYRRDDGGSQHTLKYTRAETVTGGSSANWPAAAPVSGLTRYFSWISLADVDGKPAIASIFDVSGTGTTHFRIGLDADGGKWTGFQPAGFIELESGAWNGTRIVSSPGWCGIGTSLFSGGAVVFYSLQFN